MDSSRSQQLTSQHRTVPRSPQQRSPGSFRAGALRTKNEKRLVTVQVNKPGAAKVSAIPKAQKAQSFQVVSLWALWAL